MESLDNMVFSFHQNTRLYSRNHNGAKHSYNIKLFLNGN